MSVPTVLEKILARKVEEVAERSALSMERVEVRKSVKSSTIRK
ncbi:MAG: indole-3-glycerol-phosphate synthase TrpC, partial [Gammaproteobacteria bacterium]